MLVATFLSSTQLWQPKPLHVAKSFHGQEAGPVWQLTEGAGAVTWSNIRGVSVSISGWDYHLSQYTEQGQWASINQLAAWMEQKGELLLSWLGTKTEISHWLFLGLKLASFKTRIYAISSPGSQAFGLTWELNHWLSWLSTCWVQILELLSLHNCMSQFLITLPICVFISSWFFFSGETYHLGWEPEL